MILGHRAYPVIKKDHWSTNYIYQSLLLSVPLAAVLNIHIPTLDSWLSYSLPGQRCSLNKTLISRYVDKRVPRSLAKRSQYSAAELLKILHHVSAPTPPPGLGLDIPLDIALQSDGDMSFMDLTVNSSTITFIQ